MAKRKALFLDRDGVINKETGYVHRRDEFTFQEGIFDLCSAAEALGYLLFVVTNQAGIARGYYTESDFLELTDWMITEFRRRRILITKVYYCPCHPVHGVGKYRIDSLDRKPKPGMLLRAQSDYDLDLNASVLIGDKLSDIDAAEAAGVGTRIWLRAQSETLGALPGQCHVADRLDDIRSRFFCPSVETVDVANLLGRGGETSRRSGL
jgi:D-glycero-D-manno-heptose 1,7-bisphosphate phosphatase